LSKTAKRYFFTSDFSLHSMGILFFYRKQQDIFQQFLKDMIIDAGMSIISFSKGGSFPLWQRGVRGDFHPSL